MKKILFWVSLIIFLILIVMFVKYSPSIKIESIYMQKLLFVSKILLPIGIVIAAFQFYYNNIWNKKQLAMTEVNKFNSEIEKNIKILRKDLQYGERKQPYKISEIHDLFGNFVDNGQRFEYHKQNGQNTEHNMYDGEDKKDNIVSLLNKFEYISTGVNLGIFDEIVVKRLLKGKLLYCYNMFENYIFHIRKEHGWENVYTELENLAKRWEEKKN